MFNSQFFYFYEDQPCFDDEQVSTADSPSPKSVTPGGSSGFSSFGRRSQSEAFSFGSSTQEESAAAALLLAAASAQDHRQDRSSLFSTSNPGSSSSHFLDSVDNSPKSNSSLVINSFNLLASQRQLAHSNDSKVSTDSHKRRSPRRNRYSNRMVPINSNIFRPLSKELSDFRAGRLEFRNLYALNDCMIEFANDQFGARFIQNRLMIASASEVSFCHARLLPYIRQLSASVFAHHIVQLLLDIGDNRARHQICNQLRGHILTLAQQTYGCRVLQKAFEIISLEDILSCVEEIRAHVLQCLEDQNGNHVIQKCVERLPYLHLDFIFLALKGQAAQFSIHCYGCRVIQRILEYCPLKCTESILDEIVEEFDCLARHQYGNYVIQHVLIYGRQQDQQAIVEHIVSDLVRLSSDKVSSNVVEKCLERDRPVGSKNRIIRAALKPPDDRRPPFILQMVRDRYGNYVVQRMLEVSDEALYREISTKLEKHLPALKKFTYGKHIVAALKRLRNVQH